MSALCHTHMDMDAVDYRGLKNANQVKAFLYNSTPTYLSAGYVTLAPLKLSHFDYFPCYTSVLFVCMAMYSLCVLLVYTYKSMCV